MRSGVGAFWVGSRLDACCFLVDFFFWVAVLELAGAEEEPACCGAGVMAEAGLAARRVVTDTLAASVMSSDAAIESLVIFLRYSSLPGAHLFERQCVRCGVRSPIMMIFRAASSRAARCGAYRATGTELDWMRVEEQGLRGRRGNNLAKVRVFRLTGVRHCRSCDWIGWRGDRRQGRF